MELIHTLSLFKCWNKDCEPIGLGQSEDQSWQMHVDAGAEAQAKLDCFTSG